MRNAKPLVLAACLASLFPTTVSAASARAPYVSAVLGLATVLESDITDSTVPGVTAELSADRGLALDVGLGYDFGPSRIEASLVYQKHALDTLDLGVAAFTADGDVSTLSLMCNGYYDFATNGPLQPFITAGIGMARVKIDGFNIPATGLPPVSDRDTVAAFQLGAGLGFQLTNRTTLDLMYRYFATADLQFETTQAEFASHKISVGLRVSF